jgi:hypothetical protein
VVGRHRRLIQHVVNRQIVELSEGNTSWEWKERNQPILFANRIADHYCDIGGLREHLSIFFPTQPDLRSEWNVEFEFHSASDAAEGKIWLR